MSAANHGNRTNDSARDLGVNDTGVDRHVVRSRLIDVGIDPSLAQSMVDQSNLADVRGAVALGPRVDRNFLDDDPYSHRATRGGPRCTDTSGGHSCGTSFDRLR